ncbi:MAG TPA: efflux RND transporter permease subunit [Anaeromyxobacteraceae bacterium]|nr:efflux RND transporter permease subunit [Anaeromyxobacteraceae bacterium]
MVSRIIELCARNRLPVFLGVALAALGAAWSIRHVQVDAIPDLGDPQVIVYAEWMGRSPTLIEDQVTYPIVSSLIAAPRVTDVRGYSMFGMSFVYVIFEEGTDVYWARSRVQELISAVRARLPAEVTPVLGPDASGNGWAFQYTLTDRSGQTSIDEIRTFQDFTLRYALGSVPGVAEVASVGGFQKQYQVTIDPNRLRAYGVTLDEVVRAIRDSNSDVGGRLIELSGREYYVRGRGYVQDIGALASTAVRANGPSGVPVLVRDLGSVRFGPDIRRGALDWNGDGEAVGGIVVVRYGENTLEVIARVKKRIEELRAGFPPGVTLEVAYDRTQLIDRSLTTLKRALLEEALTVAAVILLFLTHIRSALVPVLSLPLAVALAFIPMYLFDVPATIMSLGGIAIAIGATVDAEIVMIEASHKKLEHAPKGADRHRLLAEAAREVTPAVFFSLIVVAVGFLPVFTLSGQAGRLFRPLAFTKTFVMLSAALLSVTFAPALRDLVIRGRIRLEAEHPLSRAIIRIYKPFVFVALRRPKTTLAIGLLAVLSAVPLALRLGSEFMPPLDEGDVLYMPTTLPNVSIEEAKRALQRQDRVLRSFPEVASVFGKVGRADTATDPAPITMVETTVRLRPRSEWRQAERQRWYSRLAPEWLKSELRRLWPERGPVTPDALVAEMNRAMQFPGWTNAFTMPIRARIDMLATGVRTPVGIKVLGGDIREIEKLGVALEHVLAPVPGTRSIYYERNTGGLYLDIYPNRDALARYGLTVGDVQRTIEAAVGGSPVTTTVEGRNRFSISVRYPQDLRNDLEALKRVLVPIRMGSAGGTGGMGVAAPRRQPDLLLAQGMGMGGGSPKATGTPLPPSEGGALSDAPALDWSQTLPRLEQVAPGGRGLRATSPPPAPAAFVPLGQVAEIKIAGGPPMLRDEGGLLVGYVYVDVEPWRDIGSYVRDAKARAGAAIDHGDLVLPAGYFLHWTGQYELLEKTNARLRIVVPLTLLLIVGLLLWHFRNLTEVMIVLLSVPFALVGSVWLLWALDYHLSTAVWIGIIALVGLAAQTGIVMIVYIDQAYERRRSAGKIRDLSDIVWAHMEGTVMRVRPKLMTVGTMLVGLLPLLWATGSGADVMKRIAAPMVGGLVTSAFLTLEIIPVVYTYWRQEQVLWERLDEIDPAWVGRLRRFRNVQRAGWAGLALAAVLAAFLPGPRVPLLLLAGASALVALAGIALYLRERPAAVRSVWPAAGREAGLA